MTWIKTQSPAESHAVSEVLEKLQALYPKEYEFPPPRTHTAGSSEKRQHHAIALVDSASDVPRICDIRVDDGSETAFDSSSA